MLARETWGHDAVYLKFRRVKELHHADGKLRISTCLEEEGPAVNPLDYFTAVAGFASISGLAYALYLSKHGRWEKSLVYEVSPPVPIATAVSPGGANHLSVLLKRKDGVERRISSVYVRFLRFANLGRESIRGTDIAPSNRLKIIASGGNILDVSLDHQSREVNNVFIFNNIGPSREHVVDVTFDFLDRDDGATIRVLTEGSQGDFLMVGDIIGMPRGIKRGRELPAPTWTSRTGCVLGITMQMCSWSAFAFIYYKTVGSFEHLWLLALALTSVFLPIAIMVLVTRSFRPSLRARLPESLTLPEWYKALRTYHYGLVFEEADPERIRQKLADEAGNGNASTRFETGPQGIFDSLGSRPSERKETQ